MATGSSSLREGRKPVGPQRSPIGDELRHVVILGLDARHRELNALDDVALSRSTRCEAVVQVLDCSASSPPENPSNPLASTVAQRLLTSS